MGQPGQTSLSERLRSIEAEIAAGQAESALAHCQEIFAQFPRALAVQRVLGEIYLALHKPREALGALDRALAGDPEDARACCARAVIHQMHGDPNAALAWYRRACDTRPDDQALRATYREMASHLGGPPYQPTRVGLARIYMRGSLFPHAVREWETLIAENGDLLEAQVGLVETLWRAERIQEAEEWARRVLMNAPSCVKPLLIMGVITRDTNRTAEAERYLQRAAELDPDHRIARALFADRAMANAALRTLFWGDEPVVPTPSQRMSYGPQQQTGRATLNDLQSALSRPDLSANLSHPLAAPGRPQQPQQLPAEFHSMFKETENMLWGPDHSDPGAAPTMAMPAPQAPGQPPTQTGALSPAPPTPSPIAPEVTPPTPPMPMAAPPGGRLGSPPVDHSAQFVPPAIAESQFALGDTETRRAIRWVQWLQAQGARMRSDEMARSRPTGSLDALLGGSRQAPMSGQGNGAPASPTTGWGAQLPVTSLPSTGPTFTPSSTPSTPLTSAPASRPSATSAPLSFGASASATPGAPAEPGQPAAAPLSGPLTGSMPAPKPEDLRHMFAELGAAEAASRPQEGVDPAPAPQAAPQAASEASAGWPEALADAFEWPSQPGAQSGAARDGHVTPDLTLEALEGAHSAEGYRPFTLEPGALAAFGNGNDETPAGETSRTVDELFQGPEMPAHAEPSAQPAISPTDYPARLTAARTLRDDGDLDKALVEYQALLKNAPDLLPDVLSDLEASLDEQPEHPELHRLLGDARIRQGDYMAALESLNRSVSLNQPSDE